jgi:hypothetical protein
MVDERDKEMANSHLLASRQGGLGPGEGSVEPRGSFAAELFEVCGVPGGGGGGSGSLDGGGEGDYAARSKNRPKTKAQVRSSPIAVHRAVLDQELPAARRERPRLRQLERLNQEELTLVLVLLLVLLLLLLLLLFLLLLWLLLLLLLLEDDQQKGRKGEDISTRWGSPCPRSYLPQQPFC